MGPKRPIRPEHELIVQSMPWALRLARTTAFFFHVTAPDQLEDCEQVGCQALLEALPGWDPARGPFDVYAWKRVVGAVTTLVRRELSSRRRGLHDAFDKTDELRDTSDPFEDEDADVLDSLKGDARSLAFAYFMGDTRIALSERPEDAITRARAFEALAKALGGIDDGEKQLVALRYWEGLPWEDVAVRIGEGVRQANRIDERIRNRLRRGLRQQRIDEAPPSA